MRQWLFWIVGSPPWTSLSTRNEFSPVRRTLFGSTPMHERVPLISWPYEWSFSMLRAAALLTLELMEQALADDAILKDATPFNVQFRGAFPVLIDTGSIVPLEAGQPWEGYGQFCRMILFPLMLQSWKGTRV